MWDSRSVANEVKLTQLGQTEDVGVGCAGGKGMGNETEWREKERGMEGEGTK